ncbi:MAG: ankyrin repeat domain-containing protein [Gammaproteobacteria bacterium]|nr:ankyrin repeat domain-containing protein [Gammaproteobacteria bacterium]MBU1656079.1 ankyrin repeat domain-containing protein [Gammaproteobacteria bacterium]MBU1960348.1 ankyrin repeat domain-containing protein [Gammaproteobacteria bacterium]
MRIPLILFLLALLSACGEVDKPSVGLYLAMQRGDLDQIERHIHWGADLNQPLPGGKPPLHMAAGAGRLAITRILLKQGADPAILDDEGQTALYRALESGRTQVADILVKNGARLDATPLLLTLVELQIKDRDVIAFLAERGADLNAPGGKGMTPLTQAIQDDNRVLVKQLIHAGADVNRPDAQGNRPLAVATQRGNRDIIRLLGREGATTE